MIFAIGSARLADVWASNAEVPRAQYRSIQSVRQLRGIKGPIVVKWLHDCYELDEYAAIADQVRWINLKTRRVNQVSEHLQDVAVEDYGCCGDSGDCMCKSAPGGKATPSADELLVKVHERLGLGVDIETFSEDKPPTVEIHWRRDYDGAWGDLRYANGNSLAEVLQAVLDYEDEADKADSEDDG